MGLKLANILVGKIGYNFQKASGQLVFVLERILALEFGFVFTYAKIYIMFYLETLYGFRYQTATEI